MVDLVEAHTIKSGECFRKKDGEYVYLRISDASADYLKLDPTKVHGVAYNSNVAVVDREALVVRETPASMEANRGYESKWEKSAGAGNYEPDPDPEAGTYQPEED